MHQENQELMDRIAKGDLDAFASLYDRFAGRMFGLIVRIVPNRRDAEDVLQEAMWQVWQNSGRYSAKLATPATWLLMIARSRAIDRLRQIKKKPLAWEDISPLVHDSQSVSAQEQSEQEAITRKAISRLPDEQRDPICLSFYCGLTHEQISNLLETPLGTIKTRIRSGMQQLREDLAVHSEIFSP